MESKIGFSSFILKIIAIITMVLDHAIKIVFSEFSVPLELICIGRMAFPLFAFLIAEGARHTTNMLKYIIRIGILAIFSEIIYDLAFRNTFLEFSFQNVLFELFLGLLVIWLYQWLKKKDKPEFILFPLLFSTVIAELANFDYGMGGILCIFIFYFAQENKGILRYILYILAILMTTLNSSSAFLMYIQMFSLLAFIPICLYNGGKGVKINKYVFYGFYPLHILILYIIDLFTI